MCEDGVNDDGLNQDGVNDDRLMVAAARGNTEAFRRLVSRWEQSLFAFLYHMVGSTEDAEDIAQETFLRVHAQAAKYQPAGKFQSWFFRIAGNLARSHLRRRRVLRWLRFDADRHDRPDPSPWPDERLAAQQLQEEVRIALAALPVRQRQAMVLRRYQGLSYREVATILDTTPAAVESLLQRAATALRRSLAGKVQPT